MPQEKPTCSTVNYMDQVRSIQIFKYSNLQIFKFDWKLEDSQRDIRIQHIIVLKRLKKGKYGEMYLKFTQINP